MKKSKKKSRFLQASVHNNCTDYSCLVRKTRKAISGINDIELRGTAFRMILNHLINSKPEWDKVVEDKIIHNKNHSNPDMKLKQFWMLELVRYFLGQEPVSVRIKCRKGCIQIERVKA